jgi:hypothetical protein
VHRVYLPAPLDGQAEIKAKTATSSALIPSSFFGLT